MNTYDILNNNIIQLQKEIQELSDEIKNDSIIINTHPIIFVILIIGMFITLDFWSISAQQAVHKFNKNKKLEFWEYTLISIALLILILFIGYIAGFEIKMLEDL